jgi:hypothetical protein
MTRDQRLIAAFTTLAVLALGVVGAGLVFEGPPPVPAVSRDVPIGPDATLTLRFVGDTSLGDEVQNQIDRRGIGYDWPFDAVRSSTTDADFAIAVAETPISTLTAPFNRAKRYSYSSRPEAAGAMSRAGIDAVQLANNHAYDTGPVGLADTIANLDAAGIAGIGAGPDLARAEQPLLLRTEVGTIGVVAMGESFGDRAAQDAAGTLVISPETVRRGAALARAAGADWVIAFVHWGENYQPVNAQQRAAAQDFAAAGYDMVVGSGPHTAQPIELIGSMPVVYSVGNFVFGTPGRWAANGVVGQGLVAEVALARDRAPQLSVRCLLTDNTVVGYQPRPCGAAQARAVLPTVAPQLEMRDDTAVLTCPGCFPRRGPGA